MGLLYGLDPKVLAGKMPVPPTGLNTLLPYTHSRRL